MKKFLAAFCAIILISLTGCAAGVNLLKEKIEDSQMYTSKGEFLVTSAGVSGDEDVNHDVAASINFMPTVLSVFNSDSFKTAFYDHLTENFDVDISKEELFEAYSVYREEKISLIITAEIKTDSKEKSDKIMTALLEFAPVYIESKIPGIIVDAITEPS